MSGIIIVLGVLILIAIVLVIIGIRHPYTTDEDKLYDRLGDFTMSGEQVNLEKLEMTLPFSERVIYPIARKLGEFTMRFTPQNWLNNTTRKLELAGRSAKWTPRSLSRLNLLSRGLSVWVRFSSCASWVIICRLAGFFYSLLP